MLHPSTFGYLKPSDEQQAVMADVRAAFCEFAATIDPRIPEGPDKTYLMRKLRECAMWANIAITRQPDGAPRT